MTPALIARNSLRLLCAPWLPRTPRDSQAIPISAPAAVSASTPSSNLQPLTSNLQNPGRAPGTGWVWSFTNHESPVTNHSFLVLVTHHSLALRRLPAAEGSLATVLLGFSPSLITNPLSLITGFLIGSSANRASRNPRRISNLKISNRLQNRGRKEANLKKRGRPSEHRPYPGG